jgi:GDP/UDP-N,N'-diacetylbacillosamine 2-epimerase (hydrolysing)
MKTKILVYSVGRSDLDRYEPILKCLKNHKSVKLITVGSYLHYLSVFGNTYKYLEKYNLQKRNKKKNLIDTPTFISENLSNEIKFITKVISKQKPHIIIVLGDRYEMLAAPISAIPFNIPIVHFYGGAVTYGAIDELVRHSITKMSHFHLTAHDVYSKRILRMGEENWRVKTIGILNIVNLKKQKILTDRKVKNILKLDFRHQTLLVTIHPTTLDNLNLNDDIKNLLKAIKKTNMQAVFTYPNSDYGYKIIINSITNFCKKSKKYIFLKNLTSKLYPTLLKKCVAMIGNSSSGIVESASFSMPVVNLGTRQDGKVHGKNIISCDFKYKNILKALNKVTSKKFLNSIKNIKNHYEPKISVHRICNLILKLKSYQNLLKKKFNYTSY